jgi:hypothetical protein
VVLIVPRLLYPPLSDGELDQDAVTGKDRVQLRNERLRLQNDVQATLLQGLAGGVLLLGAYFMGRQLQLSRQQLSHALQATAEQLDATRRKLAIAQEGQLADRPVRARAQRLSPASAAGSLVRDTANFAPGNVVTLMPLAAQLAVRRPFQPQRLGSGRIAVCKSHAVNSYRRIAQR